MCGLPRMAHLNYHDEGGGDFEISDYVFGGIWNLLVCVR